MTAPDIAALVERLEERKVETRGRVGAFATASQEPDPLCTEAAAALTALSAQWQEIEAHLTARAKSMLKLRDVLVGVTEDVEDEGGRVYFGSTNHCDMLRDVTEDFDSWAWDDIIRDGAATDYIGDNARLRAELTALSAERDALREEVLEAVEEAHSKIDDITVAADRMERQGYDEPLLCRILDEAAQARSIVTTLSAKLKGETS